MFRQPVWIALAIVAAFGVALAFLVVRGGCGG